MWKQDRGRIRGAVAEKKVHFVLTIVEVHVIMTSAWQDSIFS